MPPAEMRAGAQGRGVRRGRRGRGARRTGLELRVLQLNAGRSAASTSAILELARKEDFDVVLLQEPGGRFGAGRTLPRILGQHFQVYLPAIGDDHRPRVAAYVRKHDLAWTPIAQTTITRGNGDILILDFAAPGGQCIRVVNVYNAPAGSGGSGDGLEALLGLPQNNMPGLVAGDFNLHHSDWSVEWWADQPSPAARGLADHMAEQQWVLGLEPGTVTRPSASGGSALDLVLLNRWLDESGWVSSCETRTDLAAGSDHWPIATKLLCGAGSPLARELRFRYDRANWDRLRLVLAERKHTMLQPYLRAAQHRGAELPSFATLDALAAAIQQWINAALTAAVPRTVTTGQGHPW